MSSLLRLSGAMKVAYLGGRNGVRRRVRTKLGLLIGRGGLSADGGRTRLGGVGLRRGKGGGVEEIVWVRRGGEGEDGQVDGSGAVFGWVDPEARCPF